MDFGQLSGSDQQMLQTLLFLSLLTLPFKGMAIWKAAQIKNKFWFITLFLVNTLGILDIIYYFFVDSKPKKTISKK